MLLKVRLAYLQRRPHNFLSANCLCLPQSPFKSLLSPPKIWLLSAQNQTMPPTYHINPIQDARWNHLLEKHPDASIFHTPGWLRALKRTYGYEPIVFTTSRPGFDLSDGIVFCQVKSWVTGSRLVSLPFSDHCQPLVDNSATFDSLLSALCSEARDGRWKYIELRPRVSQSAVLDCDANLPAGEQFCFHCLDLSPDIQSVSSRFHKSCIQRKIRRAEREHLSYQSGRSTALLGNFYQLLVRTRRRHQLPPQPLAWFENLVDCLGESLTIRVLSKDEQPIASIMTLAFKTSLVYKYGCSDERFHNLGGMPLLFWNAIQEAKQSGYQELDFGRSELDNEGLIQFKGHFGAHCSRLTYYRSPAAPTGGLSRNWGTRATRHVLSRVPDSVLIPVGNLLYRHLG